jgi:hypothetical protein
MLPLLVAKGAEHRQEGRALSFIALAEELCGMCLPGGRRGGKGDHL